MTYHFSKTLDMPCRSASAQSRGNTSVIGEERTDLAAFLAATHDTVSGDAASVDCSERDGIGLRNPSRDETLAHRGKTLAIIGKQLLEGHIGRCHHMRAPDAVHAPLIADVAVCEPEPGLPVVSLLGNDTIKTDVAVAKVTHAMLPDLHAEAFAAKPGFHDVQTDEAKVFVIGDGGEGRDRLAAPNADEEPGRVCFSETARVVPAGVPPFRSRPFDRHGHLAG